MNTNRTAPIVIFVLLANFVALAVAGGFAYRSISSLQRRASLLEDNVSSLDTKLRDSEKMFTHLHNEAVVKMSSEADQRLSVIQQSLDRAVLTIHGASKVATNQIQKDCDKNVNLALFNIRTEAQEQLAALVSSALLILKTNTFDELRSHRVTVLDDSNNVRIALGYGRSKISKLLNSSIEIFEPSGGHSLYLSATERGAGAHFADSLVIGASKTGGGNVAIYTKTYEGNQPRVNLTVNDGGAGLFVYDSSRVRSGIGVNQQGLAFNEMLNSAGAVVYGVHTDANDFATTLLKQDPASSAWSAAGAISTIKTFIDFFRR